MSLIFLIGMPGSGKTSLARLWARSYNWQVLDMDAIIEQRHGRIPALFEAKGETYFRELEQQLLQEIITARAPKTLVATGGGTPCFFDNLNLMKDAGCVVYLKASMMELRARLAGSTNIRPLLAGEDQQERIRKLLEQREPIYSRAHHTYPALSLTEATFVEIIDACTNRRS